MRRDQRHTVEHSTLAHHHTYGLVSYLMIDGEYLIATGHGEEAAGLPVFEIRCMCMPQLAHGDPGDSQ